MTWYQGQDGVCWTPHWLLKNQGKSRFTFSLGVGSSPSLGSFLTLDKAVSFQSENLILYIEHKVFSSEIQFCDVAVVLEMFWAAWILPSLM